MKTYPLRLCVGCGQMINKDGLVRVVKTGKSGFVADMTYKMNGRSAYVCKNKDCVAKMVKSKGLDRSFKMHVPQEVYDSVVKEIEG